MCRNMDRQELHAREHIDQLLTAAGWQVCTPDAVNVHAHRGVAIREFPLESGHGFADYLLYVDSAAAGVIETKREGVTLSGVETQSDKYTKGLPDGLAAWRHPLPFAFQSTGIETRFTNGLDPQPRARPVFAFHKPDLLADLLGCQEFERIVAADSLAADPSRRLDRRTVCHLYAPE